MALLFAAGFGLLGSAAFLTYRHFRGDAGAVSQTARQSAATPPAASVSATPGAAVLQRAVEVTGIRMVEDRNKKTEVLFVVVNHSAAPLTDLSGAVTLRPSTAQPGKELVGIFGFRNLSLGPFESRELRAPLNTTLRPYELPDWQFLRVELSLSLPSLER